MVYTCAWRAGEGQGRSLKLTLVIRPDVGSHVGVRLWVRVIPVPILEYN
jgi:hypothetical protein